MDRVNSVRLNKFDAYLRPFAQSGVYHYRINYLSEDLTDFQAGSTFEVLVLAMDGEESGVREEAEQHYIQVFYDAEGRQFRAEPESLEIVVGDTVLWYKPNKEGGDYSLTGESEEGIAFDSRRLRTGEVFMHTFRQVGEYRYTNMAGRGGQQSGVVKVVEAGPDREEWVERVKKPALVRYADGAFAPRNVEIVQWSAVIWVVEDDTATITIVAEEQSRPSRIVRHVIGNA
jgi:plastocyanin